MTVTSPHSESTQKTMVAFKQYTNSLEGWDFIQEKDGVKVYSKSDSTSHLIVRGDYILTGTEYNVKQVSTVANSPGARKAWDEKFDVAELKQLYNVNEALFWSKVKTPWPVSPRDMVTASLRDDVSKDEIYTILVSVEDSAAPAVSGCVRANLYLSGWKVFKTDAGVGLTYITQIDLAGSIPTSLLKSVHQQTPLLAGKVGKYIKDNGFPPYAEGLTCTFEGESFDHGKKEYVLELDGSGDANIFTSKKMFSSGVKVNTSGKASHKIEGDKVFVTGVEGPTTIKITRA